MSQSSSLLTLADTIVWLKIALSVATLVLLYLRYRKARASGAPCGPYSFRAKALISFALLFSFAVFHDFGKFPGGAFVHPGEMFHYYLGSKYFKEVGYDDLYNAVIVADTEQDNALAQLPFYTNLETYQDEPRETALQNIDRVKNLFSTERWDAFKQDVSFFKRMTGMPRSPGIIPLLMDHGYNASPASTFILSALTNLVPVTHLGFLAALDVVLVAAMIGLVFDTFGFEMGALFGVYFFVNILNDHDYISGSLLRYDWLLYIVVAVCLLERGRYASSAFFLTLSAMMRIFPAVLFCGIGITMFRKAKAAGTVDKRFIRFVVTAGATGLLLFVLPTVQLGSAVRSSPWDEFVRKMELHENGVYVNHLGFRGVVLYEPSHLSVERFIETFKSSDTDDIVRHWQDVKEQESREKKPLIVFSSLFVLVCLTAIIWKRKEDEVGSVLWPLMLIYFMSYSSHYYYVFLCLFVLLFFRRIDPLSAFVPLCLLLVFNIVALVTSSFVFSPTVFPIVFFTLLNIYLFVCFCGILAFELYTLVFRKGTLRVTVRSTAS